MDDPPVRFRQEGHSMDSNREYELAAIAVGASRSRGESGLSIQPGMNRSSPIQSSHRQLSEIRTQLSKTLRDSIVSPAPPFAQAANDRSCAWRRLRLHNSQKSIYTQGRAACVRPQMKK